MIDAAAIRGKPMESLEVVVGKTMEPLEVAKVDKNDAVIVPKKTIDDLSPDEVVDLDMIDLDAIDA